MQPQRGALCAQRRGLFCVVLLAVRSPRARSPLAGAQRGVWRTWRVWQPLACAPRPVCGGCLSDALCAGSATLSLVLGLLLAYYGSHGVSLSGAKVRRASALATSDDVGGSVCALLCVHSAAHASVASRVSRCRPPCCACLTLSCLCFALPAGHPLACGNCPRRPLPHQADVAACVSEVTDTASGLVSSSVSFTCLSNLTQYLWSGLLVRHVTDGETVDGWSERLCYSAYMGVPPAA